MLAFALRTHGWFLSRGGTGSDLNLNILPRASLPSENGLQGSQGRSGEVSEEGTAAVLAGDEGVGLG